MNKGYIISIIFCILTSVLSANAQVVHHASWDTFAANYVDVNGNALINSGGTHIVNLYQDVDLTGTITVDNATSLRFVSRNSSGVTIRNAHANSLRPEPMFRVIGDAKLAFNYYDVEDKDLSDAELKAKYGPLTIDGGADFSPMDKTSDPDGVWRLTAGYGAKKFTTSLIESIGAVEMYNVTVRNYYVPNHGDYNESGIIGLAPGRLQSKLPASANTNLNYRYTTIKNCVIENCKGNLGVFIYVGNCAYLNRDADPNGLDQYGSNRFITLDGVTVRNCVTFCDSNGWGGLIRCRGGSLYSMKMKNCLFENNFSHNDGAVLWWNAGGHPNTKCTIDGCIFRNNRAMREAGALRLEGSFEFTGNKTVVSGNECFGKERIIGSPDTYVDDPDHPGNGGGIQIYGYAGTADAVGGTLTYNLPSCLEVTDNYARNCGGGISLNVTTEAQLREGTVINAEFNGAIIRNNEAAVSGGGVYFSNTSDPSKNYDINIWLNSGDISENESLSGGGLYVKNLNINSKVTAENIIINKNTATRGCGGGIYLENGDVTLNSIDITENKAYKVNDNDVYGGGGLFVKAGSFTINSGSIADNYTDLYGGGVLVYNVDLSERHKVDLTNGLIKKNKAKYGGGIAGLGFLELNVNNINLEDNRAMNGGGVFAKGIASGQGTLFNYKSGIIRYNRARSYETGALTTVYNKGYSEYSGIGGGIYMGQFTHLKIEDPSNFGIYSNVADNGADDLFGYNKNVYVELPDVADLNLNDYSTAKTHELFWAEDYITNDTSYDKGTMVKGSAWYTDRTNQRYRDIRENGVEGQFYFIDFTGKDVIHYGIDASGNSTYLCLTLGWNVSKIKLVKQGMSDGENVIFKLYKINDDNSESEYMTVLLSDKDKQSDGSRMKEITLNSDGRWKIVETSWSWAYTPANTTISKELNANSSDEERTFVFVNTPKEVPSHNESVKINNMTNTSQMSD